MSSKEIFPKPEKEEKAKKEKEKKETPKKYYKTKEGWIISEEQFKKEREN